MSKFSNRNVTYARLHSTADVPKLGQLGPSLHPNDPTKPHSMGMTITLEGDFLVVRSKGHEVVLPLTSVSHMVLAKDEAPAKKV